METLSPQQYFLQQGILGVIIVVMGAVIVWQQKRSDKKDVKIDELQDKLKSQADMYAATYVATTKEVVGTQHDNINATNLLQKSFETFVTSFQSFINGRGAKS